MTISVKYRGELAELTKISAESISADTVSDVLKHIKRTYGTEAHKAAKRMLIAVNGKSVLLLKNEKTALKDGDTVSFLPICGGG